MSALHVAYIIAIILTIVLAWALNDDDDDSGGPPTGHATHY
ncbi:hypothetical protein SIB_21 [Klebsiella phage vB_KpnP_Sibilus]|uniref:Uncharacterized protein n=2 Tax=Ningirsuvirus TaxID=2732688 RepID=A0A384ZVV3_9CAUD|nr:hypothetical protein HOU07_gp12 [Dickeya phage vB_DsoP_JA10]AXG66365.1 hypothetical protein JA10_012 [Dickeya phage vB_DsoP_JA10]QEG12922.1 hypothetical protein SIB_21 [Klebsiella phage vB_KpnP_Sibilus]